MLRRIKQGGRCWLVARSFSLVPIDCCMAGLASPPIWRDWSTAHMGVGFHVPILPAAGRRQLTLHPPPRQDRPPCPQRRIPPRHQPLGAAACLPRTFSNPTARWRIPGPGKAWGMGSWRRWKRGYGRLWSVFPGSTSPMRPPRRMS